MTVCIGRKMPLLLLLLCACTRACVLLLLLLLLAAPATPAAVARCQCGRFGSWWLDTLQRRERLLETDSYYSTTVCTVVPDTLYPGILLYCSSWCVVYGTRKHNSQLARLPPGAIKNASSRYPNNATTMLLYQNDVIGSFKSIIS